MISVAKDGAASDGAWHELEEYPREIFYDSLHSTISNQVGPMKKWVNVNGWYTFTLPQRIQSQSERELEPLVAETAKNLAKLELEALNLRE